MQPSPGVTRKQLDEALGAAEQRVQQLSAALLAGEAEASAAASAAVQLALQQLHTLVPLAGQRGWVDAQRRARLQRLGHVLSWQREACLRRHGLVERSLHSLLPATRATTYGGGAGPYGARAARTGAFARASA